MILVIFHARFRKAQQNNIERSDAQLMLSSTRVSSICCWW